LDDIINKIRSINKDINDNNNNIANARHEVERASSILFKFASIFSGETINVIALKNKIQYWQESIHLLKKNKMELLLNLEQIYDYWPTYPPDWEDRRSILLKEHNCCSNPECGSTKRSLQVHHIVPFVKGGSHKKDNLLVLCDKCHKLAHDVYEFYDDHEKVSFRPEYWTENPRKLLPYGKNRRLQKKYYNETTGRNIIRDNIPGVENKNTKISTHYPDDIPSEKRYGNNSEPGSSSDSLISKRKKKVEEAIKSGQYIHFNYTRYDGAKSERTIQPKQIIMIENTPCISGYCFLRQAKRTFAFKRMHSVEIINYIKGSRDI